MNLSRYSSHLRSALARVGYVSRPHFLILGAQKGGTVALHNYLSVHPGCRAPRQNEIGFFDQEVLFRKGKAWYHQHFDYPHVLGARRITFDCTPEYLYYPEAPRRIFEYDPDMLMIALLRDPIQRAYSAWNMYRKLHAEHRSYLESLLPSCDPPAQTFLRSLVETDDFPGFAEATDEELSQIRSGSPPREPGYVQRGIYHDQLERYFRLFGREKVAVISSRRFYEDTRAVLNDVARFLGLAEFDWPELGRGSRHVGSYEADMPEETRARLHTFYGPHNERLFDLLGYSIDWGGSASDNGRPGRQSRHQNLAAATKGEHASPED